MNDSWEKKKVIIMIVSAALAFIAIVVMLCFVISNAINGNHRADRRRETARNQRITASPSPSITVVTSSPSPTPAPTPYYDEHKANLTYIPDELGTLFLTDIEDYYNPDELEYTIAKKTDKIDETINDIALNFELEYPVITYSDGRNASVINDIMSEKALTLYKNSVARITSDDIDTSSDEYYSGNIDYQITYASNDLLCVVFQEHYFLGNIYKEYYDLDTVLINLHTGETYGSADLLEPDKSFEKFYYDKASIESPTVAECRNITLKTMGESVKTNGWANDVYKTDVIFTDGGITLAFTFHYNDGNHLARGWVTVNYVLDEIKNNIKYSEAWEYFTHEED